MWFGSVKETIERYKKASSDSSSNGSISESNTQVTSLLLSLSVSTTDQLHVISPKNMSMYQQINLNT